jgi:hypothetical protein
MGGGAPIVDVEGLTVDFVGGAKPLRPVAGVDLKHHTRASRNGGEPVGASPYRC